LAGDRNTFLTTPAVWLLWTRQEKKGSPKVVKRYKHEVQGLESQRATRCI
jgi:hypothetical protein